MGISGGCRYISGDPVQWQDFSGLKSIEDYLGEIRDIRARPLESFGHKRGRSANRAHSIGARMKAIKDILYYTQRYNEEDNANLDPMIVDDEGEFFATAKARYDWMALRDSAVEQGAIALVTAGLGNGYALAGKAAKTLNSRKYLTLKEGLTKSDFTSKVAEGLNVSKTVAKKKYWHRYNPSTGAKFFKDYSPLEKLKSGIGLRLGATYNSTVFKNLQKINSLHWQTLTNSYSHPAIFGSPSSKLAWTAVFMNAYFGIEAFQEDGAISKEWIDLWGYNDVIPIEDFFGFIDEY